MHLLVAIEEGERGSAEGSTDVGTDVATATTDHGTDRPVEVTVFEVVAHRDQQLSRPPTSTATPSNHTPFHRHHQEAMCHNSSGEDNVRAASAAGDNSVVVVHAEEDGAAGAQAFRHNKCAGYEIPRQEAAQRMTSKHRVTLCTK